MCACVLDFLRIFPVLVLEVGFWLSFPILLSFHGENMLCYHRKIIKIIVLSLIIDD